MTDNLPIQNGVTAAGRVVQTREQARVLRLIGYGMLLVSALGFLVVLADAASALDFVPVFAIAGASLYTATRIASSAAILHRQQLEVLNPFERQTVEWKEVRRFTIGRYGPFPEMGFVELQDGRAIHIWGIQSKNPVFTNDKDAKVLIDQLNEELQRIQTQSARSEPTRESTPVEEA